jgi:two-component system, NarL family, sensor histidine kinase UhpB
MNDNRNLSTISVNEFKVSRLLPMVDIQLCIKSLMLASSDEIYLIDAKTMQIVYVSESAQKNTGFDLKAAKLQKLDHLLGVSKNALQTHIKSNLSNSEYVEIKQNQKPISGLGGDFQLRTMLLQTDETQYVLVIKSALTSNEKTVQALNESESRYQAIVSNTPGMVFQFKQDSEGEIQFLYLSEGSRPLLGFEPEQLYENATLFFSILNSRDHANLNARMKKSANEFCVLDWEGRVWIDGWQDNKWINIRATPRKLNNAEVVWDGIMFNITQSKKEKLDLENSRRDLAELTAHINSIREDERKRIAREIHDDLGGNLTAIKMGMSSILDRLQANPDTLQEHIASLLFIVDETFNTVHKISGNLRPNILDLGIVDAIEWQTKEFVKHVNTPCKFTCNTAEIPLSNDQSMALFRICQEAMSNIAKYAQATEVGVDLNADEDNVVMTIIDNGIGIKSDDRLKTSSFGLRGMQERAAALHGTFRISKPVESKQGTMITVKLPI